MKHVKIFEEYYDKAGNSWEDHEFPESAYSNDGLTYLHPELESILPKLEEIKTELREIQDGLESIAPSDEDIEDAIEAIGRVFKKWEDRPLNKSVNKYNL